MLWIFNLENETWIKPKIKGDLPYLESHTSNLVQSKLIMLGIRGCYSLDLDLTNLEFEK